MTKNKELAIPSEERTLTYEQFKEVFSHARALAIIDKERKEQSKALSKLETSLATSEGIPERALYVAGIELDVPKEYLDQALRFLAPSPQQQIKDLQRINSESLNGIVTKYGNKLFNEALLTRFQALYPEKKIYSKKMYDEYEIIKEIRRNFLRSKKLLLASHGGHTKFNDNDANALIIRTYNPQGTLLAEKSAEIMNKGLEKLGFEKMEIRYYTYYDVL